MSKAQDRITLQTYKTDLSSIAELVHLVKSNQPVAVSNDEQMYIGFFATKGQTLKEDTHSRKTLLSWGLVCYDDGQTTYKVSPLGEKLLAIYNVSSGKIQEERAAEVGIEILLQWRFVDAGRDIHPCKLLLQLLMDPDLKGFITEHEFTNFLVSSNSVNDDSYDVVKNELLQFRSKGPAAISEEVEKSKSWLFLPALETTWNILRKIRAFDLEIFPGRKYRWILATSGIPKAKSQGTLPIKNWRPKVTEYTLTEAAIIELCKYFNKRSAASMFTKITGPLQQIRYGAPGTGKSFGISNYAGDGDCVFRTTFHPDSDYSTFVGAYKPTMKKVPRIVQDGTALKKPNYAADVDDALKVEEKISYEFRPQAFMSAYVAAWKEMAKGGAGKPIVLVIEEINRGNCAQIFGDLFQLLDRGDDGYSTYPIDADTDLAKWLKSDEKDENNQLLRFGSAGLGLAKPTDQKFKMKQSDWDAVMIGKKLALPSNLYIWATMNTSDQSLFPIDSAFKRRWDWKYVPIREGKYKDGQKKGQRMGWTIKFTVPAYQENGQQIPAKDYTYDWWKFLLCINKRIFKTTESEDKKLGYFFVKPDGEDATTNDGTISADRFVSKVIFYLWNDVFKDYGIEEIFKNEDIGKKGDDEKGQGVAFEDFFVEDGDKAEPKVLAAFFKAVGLEPETTQNATGSAVPAVPVPPATSAAATSATASGE